MYKAGDLVVKPNTGLCRISEVVHMSLAGDDSKDYCVLNPLGDNRTTLYVAADADRKRIRMAMNSEEAKAFIDSIPAIEAAWIENERIREQCYKDAFKSNEAASLIAIIKNMHFRTKKRLEQGKKATATDERYFLQAENILYSELAFSLELTKEEIRELVIKVIDN